MGPIHRSTKVEPDVSSMSFDCPSRSPLILDGLVLPVKVKPPEEVLSVVGVGFMIELALV